MASRLNKKELYEEFKKLQKENTKLQLFLNNSEDTKNKLKKVMEISEKENEIKDDYIKKLQEKLEEKNKDIEELVEKMEVGIEGFEKYQKQIKIKDEIIYKLEEKIKLIEETNTEDIIYWNNKQNDFHKVIYDLNQKINKLQEDIILKDEIIRLHESGEK